ncbi:hypothetical protein [Sorangium sp. So ce406]|uniref:hypothetical protein n=1 Tax=Sorangium sp. So ce406 TaxID=3133311 RepID=UPI003F5C58AF
MLHAALPPPVAAPVVFVRAEVEGAAPAPAERAGTGRGGRAAGGFAVADAVVSAGAPAAVAVAAAAPSRAPSRKAAPPGEHDTTGESALLSSAGIALSEGKATEALDVLALHERSYPCSPRAQQREALVIRAAFPHAMFLPAIEAASDGP